MDCTVPVLLVVAAKNEAAVADDDVTIGGIFILSWRIVNASVYSSLGKIPLMNIQATYEKPKNPSKNTSPIKQKHSIIRPRKGLDIVPGSSGFIGLLVFLFGKIQSNALARICAPAS